MCPFKCRMCFHPSTDFPQNFKTVLSEITQDLNKFLSCRQVTDLNLCKSCWLYFMRVHKLDTQLNLKRETCHAKILFLSSKIRGAQRSSLATGICVTSQDGNSAGASGFSVENTNDCYTESHHFREIVRVAEEEPKKLESADQSDCNSQQVEPCKLVIAFENEWLPKKCTLPTASEVVKRLSETEFIYMNKYRFHATPTGFKCGLCPAIRIFQQGRWLWCNIIRHITDWHKGDERRREAKSRQMFIEVAPNRFQYGKYTVEKTEGNYRCGECGVIKAPGTGRKARNIIEHINTEHESNPLRTYVCEHCGKVYRRSYHLKVHKVSKHENPNGQYACSECGKIFATPAGASLHRLSVHLNRNKFICETCGKTFSQKVVLWTHVASVHKKEKIKCEECGKTFGSRPALDVHRYSHTGKKYTCDICGMHFTQGYSVTRHKKTAHPP